jgi:putative peptide zinc metalloprotease protein
MCVCALLLVLSNLEEFYRRLPEFGQFFNLNNLLFMGSILIVTKSIHELGHGLMCKHFGGECHEIGFMFLVMTPAMYCNTSDSWTLPNKWHRIAIGAAGMYVEVVLAAFATFLWWYTQPGFAHFLALNIMFLCSFSTLVFNANPLLRYDGYYMLSDYLEIPNLSQKANMALVDQLKVNCLGMKPNNSRLMPQRGLLSFAVYAVASFLYRWFVMLAIFWFLIQLFRPYGLEIIGHALIAMSMIGMVVIPMFKVAKFFAWPGRFREVKMFRFLTTCALVLLIAWALFSIPVAHHVTTSFVTRPVDAQMVYATAPGTLTDVALRPGDAVSTGQRIARLENIDLQIEAERLRGQAEQLNANIASYRAMTHVNPSSARMIAEARMKLGDVERQIELQKKMQDHLISVAQRDGVVMPPPNVPARPYDSSSRQLKKWSGTPLDRENENLFVEPGTLICMVGDPDDMKATLAVEQSERALVKVGQQVTLMLDEMPGVEYSGTVNFISQDPMTSVARELSQNNGGGIATRVGANGEEVPMLTWYEVSVAIENQSEYPVMNGFRGTAKIKTSDMPLGDRLLRYITNVVRFR